MTPTNIGIVSLAPTCLIRYCVISANNARRIEGTHHPPRHLPTSPSCSPWVIPDWALGTELESSLGLQPDPDEVFGIVDPDEVFGIDEMEVFGQQVSWSCVWCSADNALADLVCTSCTGGRSVPFLPCAGSDCNELRRRLQPAAAPDCKQETKETGCNLVPLFTVGDPLKCFVYHKLANCKKVNLARRPMTNRVHVPDNFEFQRPYRMCPACELPSSSSSSTAVDVNPDLQVSLPPSPI